MINKKNIVFIISSIILFTTACNNNQTKNTNKITTTIEEELPVFLIYGELAPEGYLDKENQITEDYGFRLKRITGCEIELDEMNNANKNNNETMELMNKKYGENWMQEFEKATNYKLAIPLN
jgi:hypothetical protein